jgi:adenosylhomocysteine nucleosidase
MLALLPTAQLAIVGALDAELAPLRPLLTNPTDHQIAGMQVTTAHLADVPVLLAAVGVGKVNATLTLTTLLLSSMPGTVLCLGVAGGINPELFPGDVLIAVRTAQHDYGRQYTTGFYPLAPMNQATSERHPPFWYADRQLVDLAHSVALGVPLQAVPAHTTPRIIPGTLVSGDLFAVAHSKKAELRTLFSADACDMESAALAQVCAHFELPFLTVRGISDIAEDLDQVPPEALTIAATNAANVIAALVAALKS